MTDNVKLKQTMYHRYCAWTRDQQARRQLIINELFFLQHNHQLSYRFENRNVQMQLKAKRHESNPLSKE